MAAPAAIPLRVRDTHRQRRQRYQLARKRRDDGALDYVTDHHRIDPQFDFQLQCHLNGPLLRYQAWASAVELPGGIATPKYVLSSYSPTDSSIAFGRAFDALALALLGTTYKDSRLTQRAAISYFDSARCLRKELAWAERTETYTDSLLATPYLMLLCSNLESVVGKGYTAHLWGLANLLQKLQDRKSLLACVILDSHHQWLLGMGLWTRRSVPSSYITQSDQETLERMTDRFPALIRIALAVPALLEKADKLGPNCCSEDKTNLLEDMAKVESQIQAWLDVKSRQPQHAPINVPAWKSPSYNADFDALSVSLFDFAYLFPTFGSAMAHWTSWLALFLLTTAKLHLNTGRKDIVKIHLQEANRLAENLCKVVLYYVGGPERGIMAHIITATCLPALARWYYQTADTTRLSWCLTLRDDIRAKGLKTFAEVGAYGSSVDDPDPPVVMSHRIC